ncbi:energy transducer TonB [Lacinutrix algicola]|uniref:energy transducer TonB n=1 Tax=Lacinutrix algicola TaxID=342954 RepID=UPI0006E40912|nr:energy transducer TonB [Lacinutrix algicola]
MKNQSIILSLSILITFSFTSCNNPSKNTIELKDIAQLELANQNMNPGKAESEYYYGIGSRFEAISKTDLRNITTIFPFNRDQENEQIEKVNSTEIIIIENDRQTEKRTYGTSEKLNESQIALFKSLDYNNNFSMKTLFQEKNTDALTSEEKKFNPHYTVTPEKEATYVEGEDAIVNYLIINTKEETADLDNKKIRPAKIYFTITKEGNIKHVRIDRTTGYPVLDKKLIELISNISGQWEPAQNNNGEIIEQEFAFTFGPKGGC